MCDIQPDDWIIILPVMGMAAFIGGLLQVLYPFVDPNTKDKPNVTWKHIWVSGFFGFGGGMAVLLAATWVGKVPGSVIELVGTGIVAGFIGYRILPKIAETLESRVSAAEKDLAQAERNIKEIEANVKECLIAKYRASLISLQFLKRPSEFKDVAAELEETIKKYHDVSEFYILLGRAYKSLGEYENAIHTLDRLIQQQLTKKQLSKALFNRSCYKVLAGTDGEKKKITNERLVSSGLDDLKQAIDLFEENKEDAFVDPDFQTLIALDNPRFLNLTGKVGSKP